MFAIGDTEWPGLSKLIEEAGEVLQVGGKLMGSRGNVEHWSGDLHEKLIEEIGDLLGAIIFFKEMNLSDEDGDRIMDRAEMKANLFHKWHENKDPPPNG